MDLSELGIGIGKLEFDRTRGLGPAASNFGERIFEPVHHIDTHAVFCASYRIEDGFAAAFGYVLDDQMSASRRDVGLEVDRGENRVVQLFEGRGKNIEDSCSWLGVLTAQDAQQCAALRLGRPLVNNHRRFTLALMNGTRPAEYADELQAIELRVAMMALFDLHTCNSLAMTMGW